jgi:hypothetical protein
VALAGAGRQKSWSEAVPLEGGGVEVTGVVPQQILMGDIHKDGTPEVMLVLEVEAKDAKLGLTQKRVAAYLYELGKNLRLVWYHTLSLSADFASQCASGEVRHEGSATFGADAEGRLAEVAVKFERTVRVCKGGEGCPAGLKCSRTSDDGTLRFVLDKELKTLRLENETEASTRVPDLSVIDLAR